MLKRIMSIILSILFLAPGMVRADETMYRYDENFPSGALSLANFRASLRALHELDMMPLRPRSKRYIDSMEYSTDAAATAIYSGTGVTITHEASIVQEGSYSLKAVTDGTSNRSFSATTSLNLGAFTKITLWERSSGTSQTIRFFVQDGSSHQSYWTITTNGSANTWQQDTLTLASPSGNNGINADLTNITSYGYSNLTSSTTYYFDTIKSIVGMTVVVEGSNLGSYYKAVYIGVSPILVNAQAAPTITAPVSNPRIDILKMNSSGTLSWVTGVENSTPAIPWSSMPTNEIPICLVYNKTTETKILDYEDQATDANQGYILADVRPFLNLSSGVWGQGANVASASSMTLGNDGAFFNITGTTTITSITIKPAGTVVWLKFAGILTVTNGSNLSIGSNFLTSTGATLGLVSDGSTWYEISRDPPASSFIKLTDVPSSYSGQSLKLVRVNVGETALEFTTSLPVGNLNGGSGASSSTFWRGDGTWASVPTYSVPVVLNVNQSGVSLSSGDTTVSSNVTLSGSGDWASKKFYLYGDLCISDGGLCSGATQSAQTLTSTSTSAITGFTYSNTGSGGTCNIFRKRTYMVRGGTYPSDSTGTHNGSGGESCTISVTGGDLVLTVSRTSTGGYCNTAPDCEFSGIIVREP